MLDRAQPPNVTAGHRNFKNKGPQDGIKNYTGFDRLEGQIEPQREAVRVPTGKRKGANRNGLPPTQRVSNQAPRKPEYESSSSSKFDLNHGGNLQTGAIGFYSERQALDGSIIGGVHHHYNQSSSRNTRFLPIRARSNIGGTSAVLACLKTKIVQQTVPKRIEGAQITIYHKGAHPTLASLTQLELWLREVAKVAMTQGLKKVTPHQCQSQMPFQ